MGCTRCLLVRRETPKACPPRHASCGVILGLACLRVCCMYVCAYATSTGLLCCAWRGACGVPFFRFSGVLKSPIKNPKVRPLEVATQYGHFHSAPLADADFDAKPMVLLLGGYSVGKTSFVRWGEQGTSVQATEPIAQARLCGGVSGLPQHRHPLARACSLPPFPPPSGPWWDGTSPACVSAPSRPRTGSRPSCPQRGATTGRCRATPSPCRYLQCVGVF